MPFAMLNHMRGPDGKEIGSGPVLKILGIMVIGSFIAWLFVG